MARKVSFVLLLAVLFAVVVAGKVDVKMTKKGDCSVIAKNGQRVRVHYEGRLADGKKYESMWL